MFLHFQITIERLQEIKTIYKQLNIPASGTFFTKNRWNSQSRMGPSPLHLQVSERGWLSPFGKDKDLPEFAPKVKSSGYPRQVPLNFDKPLSARENLQAQWMDEMNKMYENRGYCYFAVGELLKKDSCKYHSGKWSTGLGKRAFRGRFILHPGGRIIGKEESSGKDGSTLDKGLVDLCISIVVLCFFDSEQNAGLELVPSESENMMKRSLSMACNWKSHASTSRSWRK